MGPPKVTSQSIVMGPISLWMLAMTAVVATNGSGCIPSLHTIHFQVDGENIDGIWFNAIVPSLDTMFFETLFNVLLQWLVQFL